MKKTLSTILCVVLTVVLCVAAVGVGAYRGWSKERAETQTAFTTDAALKAALEERAMDAANLLVVARRHLSAADETLTALAGARETLLNGDATAEELLAADETITACASALAEKLPVLASYQASARDQAYATSLTRTLAETTNAAGTYSQAVSRFNQRLKTSPTGILAGWLGVQPLGAE